jgi:hypothetical protein
VTKAVITITDEGENVNFSAKFVPSLPGGEAPGPYCQRLALYLLGIAPLICGSPDPEALQRVIRREVGRQQEESLPAES